MAARVVALGALALLLPEVRDALKVETDAQAAREEIRTLCAVGGPSYDTAVFEAAKRFDSRLDADVVRVFARMRGMEALPLYFATLRELSLTPTDRRAFFRLAARGRKDVLFTAGSFALGHTDSENWQAILAVAAEEGAVLNETVLIQALRSKNSVFRGETAWYLAKTYRAKPAEKPEEVLQALTGDGSENPIEPDPELRFGAEVLRRVLGRAPTEDEGWLACLETNPDCHLDSDFLESPLVEYLTPREREAVRRRNEIHMAADVLSGRNKAPAKGTVKKAEEADAAFSLRQITGLPVGLARDLIEAGGCRSGRWAKRFAVGRIEFRSDGLPRHVTLDAFPAGDACRQVAESLFLMSTAPSDLHPPKGEVFYVAFFDPECLVCGEEEEVASLGARRDSEIRRVRATVVPPKLTKKPEPGYPEIARKSGLQGVSIYEAVITRAGCPRDIRVVQSSHPLLDVSGMEAIARWRYKAAMLDGRPVQVYLTVTVTFNLHQ